MAVVFTAVRRFGRPRLTISRGGLCEDTRENPVSLDGLELPRCNYVKVDLVIDEM